MTAAELIRGDRPGRLRLRGDVGLENVRQLWERGRTELAGQRQLEIDLSEVERTDSAGVALLVAWTREAHAGGVVIRFANIPDQIRAIAHVCGVEAILPFPQASENAADNDESSQS
ncbi:MAG: STAS domain-containing protein [Aquisalimonadaceae bacterium]